MDGLSALSVAASVAQFIEFGSSLVSKSKQIYRSADGAPIQQVEAESATKRLLELSGRIKASGSFRGQSLQTVSREEQALQTICDGCISVSNELLSRLEKLKVQEGEKHRGYNSLRQALKSVWSKGAVDDIANRLNAFRKEMDAHILVSLSERFNSLTLLQDEKFTSLDATLQRIIEPLLRNLVDIRRKLDEVVITQNHAAENNGRRGGRICSCGAEHTLAKIQTFDYKFNSAILRSLRYPTMSHRRLEIAEAHRETFSWILHHCEQPQACNHLTRGARPWSDFVQWLRKDGGLYWMNGKAGSGKSTLMRFICENLETQSHLRYWSQNSDLQVSSFYFWNSGTLLQRSHIGLLRSLLTDVLRNRHELIRLVFPVEWDEVRSSHCYDDVHRFHLPEWDFSLKTLEKAFISLTNLVTKEFRLCFFVDGLDEYEGDPEVLVELFKEASKSPYIKVCVSSRPWIEFEEAFGKCAGLRLQDLTYEDIQIYVHAKLQSNERIQRLQRLNSVGATSLVTQIVTKANGVFLWVMLATKSLLDGLRNQDDISDLQRRLEMFPSDLDAFYGHMINCINPLYIEQASRIFQIYDSASDLNLRPTILELDLAVNATFQETETLETKMSDLEIEDRCERTTIHLKSRCGGLLEVHDVLDRPWESVADYEHRGLKSLKSIVKDFPEEPRGQQKRFKVFWKVTYLHRTVKDYLKSDLVRARLQNQVSTVDGFDPNLSLLMSYVGNLKRDLCTFYLDDGASDDIRIRMTMRDVFNFSQRVNAYTEEFQVMLQDFYELASRWWDGAGWLLRSDPSSFASWRAEFLSIAIRFGLCSFVDLHLEKEKVLPRVRSGCPLLCYALDLDIGDKEFPEYVICPPIIEALLRRGADPNEEYGPPNYTIWDCLLHRVSELPKLSLSDPDDFIMYADIIKIMLRYSVSLDACDRGTKCPESQSTAISIDSVIENVFDSRVPKEAAALRTALQQRRLDDGRKRKSDQIDTESSRKRRKPLHNEAK